MVRIATAFLAALALASLPACSSGRRAPARSAAPMPTSIAYTPGSRGNWTTAQPGTPYRAAGYQQPQPVYQPAVPAAPAPDYGNVAPFPQPPLDPAFESAPSLLTPTPGPSVAPTDWTTPSAPLPSSDWAAPVPAR